MAEQITTSFWDFINKQEIEIPIIQRDYAQGRLGKEYLRKNFLANIKQALDGTIQELKLDFVYGSTKYGGERQNSLDERQQRERLYPLDGQQRLTTLWLLHWYIALRAGKLDEQVCSILRNFTYETRITSREFCVNLCDYKKFENFDGKDIVGFIKNSTWFYSEWKQDPTIQSMLRMLGGTKTSDNNFGDGIEELFKESTLDKFVGYWGNLTSDRSPIVFYYQPLEKFGLSDDLYVKMNARGKQLTNFENLKASIIGNMHREYAQAEENEKGEWNDLLNEREGFPIKVDTIWTYMLWKYALKRWDNTHKGGARKNKYPIVDDYFMNLISYVHQTLFYFSNEDDFDDTFASQEKIFAQKDNLKFLSDFLDVWYKISEEYKGEDGIDTFFEKLLGKNGVTLWWDGNECGGNLFKGCIDKGLDLGVRFQILFYAISKYCISKGSYTVTDELKMFVRICRNLIESVYQFNRDKVECNTNIRVNEWSRYRPIIDGIINNIVKNTRWFDGVDTFGNAVKHEKDKYGDYGQGNPFVERWEDMVIFKGCLKAVLPSLKDNSNSIEDIDKAIVAFNDASEVQKIQVLIAFGYDGYYSESLGYCDDYTRQRCFFGKDGKWDVIFRRSFEEKDEERESEKRVEMAISKYVSEYRKCPSVSKLIDKELHHSKNNSFKYYMLKYPEFVNGRDGNHYFAVKGEYDDLDMINIKFSHYPLSGYHCDPFAFVICKHIFPDFQDSNSKWRQLRCFASGKNNRSSVYIHYSATDTGECFAELHSDKSGWIIRNNDEKNIEKLDELYEELEKKGIKLEYHEEGKLIPLDENEGDLIEMGEKVAKICLDWINNTFNKEGTAYA